MTVTVDLTPEVALSLTPEVAQNGQTLASYLQQLAVQEARTTPPELTEPRTPGLHAGRYWIVEDFDAPLPDSFWLGEGDADEYGALTEQYRILYDDGNA